MPGGGIDDVTIARKRDERKKYRVRSKLICSYSQFTGTRTYPLGKNHYKEWKPVLDSKLGKEKPRGCGICELDHETSRKDFCPSFGKSA